ncbi:MAG: hypothetical protein Q7R76_01095 [Candidatus Woesearchaeota archaeon]|nr:hypothetical protein [Candidatus Woesearchaeota archaeon]
MGLDIFEDIVATWLQTNGYFMMNNIRYGHNQEIDVLATKLGKNGIIHIEVSCSSNPSDIVGTKNHEKIGYEQAAINFAEKKFFNKEVKGKILALSGQEPKERWFIHAIMDEPKQLDILREKGIKPINIKDVIKDIQSSDLRDSSGNKRIKQLFDIIKKINEQQSISTPSHQHPPL